MNRTDQMGEDIPSSVTDASGNIFVLGKEISRGGQGVVYRLKDNDLALKLQLGGGRSAGINVRLLPLPDQLEICTPASVLRDGNGYVMRLLSDMQPFLDLLNARPAEGSARPSYLAGLDENAAAPIMGYAASGGIRKRLGVLARAAAALARIHAAGIFYGDISPNNVFCKLDAKGGDTSNEDDSTWWIDPDNMAFDIDEVKRRSYYTPSYGAPEVVSGKGASSSRSDAYSFAILAHHLLTLHHPFVGAAVESGEDDWETDGESAEDRAWRGELPWIFDRKDPSNSATLALSPSLVMGKELYDWFALMFEDGRLRPASRPTMLEGAIRLARACDASLKCLACGMSWLPDTMADDGSPLHVGEQCPYCGEKCGSHVEVRSYLPDSGGGWCQLWLWRREIAEGQKLKLPHRLFHPFSPRFHAEEAATAELKQGRLGLRFSETGFGDHGIEMETEEGWQRLSSREVGEAWEDILPVTRRWRFRGQHPVLVEMNCKEGA